MMRWPKEGGQRRERDLNTGIQEVGPGAIKENGQSPEKWWQCNADMQRLTLGQAV